MIPSDPFQNKQGCTRTYSRDRAALVKNSQQFSLFGRIKPHFDNLWHWPGDLDAATQISGQFDGSVEQQDIGRSSKLPVS